MLDGQLAETQIKWHEGNSACIVLASEGYPRQPRTGDAINGLDRASLVEGVTIFHAGTMSRDADGSTNDEDRPTGEARDHRSFFTAGGRVLGITSTGKDLEQALSTAYEAAGLIFWNGMQYRRDIGSRSNVDA
jgi:phosphoribosylamine--glycine ligase